jgi:two-component system, NtrC family, response regulator HydG
LSTAGANIVIDSLLLIGRDNNIESPARLAARTVYSADDAGEAAEIVKSTDIESILFDSGISPETVCTFVRTLRQKSQVPVFVIADPDDTELTQQFRQAGVTEILSTRDSAGQLPSVLRQAKRASQHWGAANMPASPSLAGMIGASPAMEHARRMIRVIADSGCNPVLIIGETGTGKELAARSVHELRHGDDARFVAINCAALTASLLESELFGHVKGAFTGADSEKIGLLEVAGGGTVFLDEISEMPLELQAKLLRVLQERIFRKVGGTTEIACNATVVASSNRNLLSEVNENRFRRDLYYRLSVCPITLPPLRSEHRRQDIPILAEHFLKMSDICPGKSRAIRGMTNLALEALIKHNWPGNVRELKNVIDRAVLLETADKIGLDNIILHPDDISHDGARSAQKQITDFSLEKAEQELITRALQETGWQKSRAASLLGITRATLYAKVKQYAIQPANGEPLEVGA